MKFGCRLLCFSETGKQIDSLYLGSNKWVEYTKLVSHPNWSDPVALVCATGASSMDCCWNNDDKTRIIQNLDAAGHRRTVY